MENLVILATHFLFFGAGMGFCVWKPQVARRAWVLVTGIFCLPVFGFLLLAMTDFSNHAGNGTHGAWYLIFSVVTLGILPLLTHLSACISGMFACRVGLTPKLDSRQQQI